MKLYSKFLTAIAAVALTTGCVDESTSYSPDIEKEDQEVGYVDLSTLTTEVLLDHEVTSDTQPKMSASAEDTTTQATTRAATRATVEASEEYIVRIYNSANECVLDTTYGELNAKFNAGTGSNLLALPWGTYQLVVNSKEEAAVAAMAWEAPVYGTKSDFTVAKTNTSDNPAQISDKVICKLANIKVTVSISADLAALLGDETKSTVSLNSAVAEFVKGESRAAYFRQQSTDGTGDTLEFHLTGTKEGKPAEITKTITGVKAGQWRKISLSIVYAETGEAKISITVDNFVQDAEITVNGTTSLWEEILEEETHLPALTWPGHDLSTSIALSESMYDAEGEYTAGAAPQLSLAAANGIQSLLLSVTSDNAAFRSEIIDAGELTDVDLCGTLPRLHAFRNLKVTQGATESPINLNSIMWIFYGYDGTHTLTFTMTDNKAQVATATVQFVYGGGAATEDPSVVCRQFNIDQPKVIASGDEIDVEINSTTGITNFVVTITSETLTEELLGAVGLQKSFDLCNIEVGSELAGALTSETIGFPINGDVKGKTSMTFTLTKFVDMLIGIPAGQHQFTLAITNESGSTVTKTLTLIVE